MLNGCNLMCIYCRCQYFAFEHSSEYQKVQFKFWEATETFDPNAIAVRLVHCVVYIIMQSTINSHFYIQINSHLPKHIFLRSVVYVHLYFPKCMDGKYKVLSISCDLPSLPPRPCFMPTPTTLTLSCNSVRSVR